MKKMKKQGGFTLVEMLIVVAIIAILVAISIPLVNAALERARDATDQANMRSAAALAQINYLAENKSGTYYYQVDETNGSQGTLLDPATGGVAPTGAYEAKCTHAGTATCHADKYIKITVNADGEVTCTWSAD